MTTYYTTKDGKILNNHDVTRAYKQTDGTVPFARFRDDFLAQRGARKINMTVDALIQAGMFREAAALFNERYKCGPERAKNTVYMMRAALGC